MIPTRPWQQYVIILTLRQDGATYREIGERLGYSLERIRQLHKRILAVQQEARRDRNA